MKQVQDHYFNLAKKEWYVARSAYKLQEIDEKFWLFWPEVMSVIDIGCAPWSWLQYTSRQFSLYHGAASDESTTSLTPQVTNSPAHQLSSSPIIIGFDLKPVTLNLPFVSTYQQDITDQEAVKTILNNELWIWDWTTDSTEAISNLEARNKHLESLKVDCIISDMAPDTTADQSSDARRSHWLIMKTMWMYEQLLKDNGTFAIKVFMGPWFEELVQYCREHRWHKSIKIFKPKACRKESKETYIVKI